MRCSRCHHETPAALKLCGECGVTFGSGHQLAALFGSCRVSRPRRSNANITKF